MSLFVHNTDRFAHFLRIRINYREATFAIKFLAALDENTRVLDMLALLRRDGHVCLHRLCNFTLLFGILRFKGFLFLQVRLILCLPPVTFLSGWAHVSSRGGCLGGLIFVFFSILINVSLGFGADARSLKLLFLLLLDLRVWLSHRIRLFRDIILFDRFFHTGGRWSSGDITLARLAGIIILLLRLWRLFLLLFFLLLLLFFGLS